MARGYGLNYGNDYGLGLEEEDNELNVGEFGQIVRVNMKQDVSTNIDLKMVLQPQVGTKLEKLTADGVAVGLVNRTIGDEIYLANQYLEYTTKDGDFTVAGQWRIKGEATMSATSKIVSDYQRNSVLP